ncbi:MAG: phospholipase D family protein [Thiomonas sp.]|nr:phospholipase D family protein [Thiomonas sp.]MDY0331341.1 phospholipase D family protein [Thiomonas sp.]
MNLPNALRWRAMLGLVLAGLACALPVQARTPQTLALPAQTTSPAAEPPQGGHLPLPTSPTPWGRSDHSLPTCGEGRGGDGPLGGQRAQASVGVNSPAAEPPQGGGSPLGGQRAQASVGVHISSAFSPSDGALTLVLQTISRAQSSIHVAAYLFTSSDVARALVQARKRGVQVQVLVDWKANFDEDARYARHALGILRNAGIAVRQIDVYPIFHDKYMVIDRRTVQTGSFNYTYSAAHRNAENVLVVWNAPELAARYLADWQRNWALGQPIKLPY